jgi:hypothetical protein
MWKLIGSEVVVSVLCNLQLPISILIAEFSTFDSRAIEILLTLLPVDVQRSWLQIAICTLHSAL